MACACALSAANTAVVAAVAASPATTIRLVKKVETAVHLWFPSELGQNKPRPVWRLQ